MQWFDDETLPTRLTSKEGYHITREPMATGHWHNAFCPDGILLASGRFDRCVEACEKHLAGEIKGRGKRQFKPPRRPRIRRSSAMLAMA